MAPHPLRIAHENLARELDAGILSSKANGNFRNAEAISQSVDRFVNEFCRLPDSTDELDRRATLVAASCAQGTEFRGRMNQAFQCLRLNSVPVAGPGISGRKLAIRNFQPVADLEFGSDLDRKVIQPILRADGESVIPVRCQQLIYDLLDECRRIKHEADHLEADGCLYLRRIGNANHSAATRIDRNTAMILKTDFGVAMLESMHAAADSLVAPVAAGPLAPKSSSGSSKATTNARMVDLITRKPEAAHWSVQNFADSLGVAKSTVHGTSAWKELMAIREGKKTERMRQYTEH